MLRSFFTGFWQYVLKFQKFTQKFIYNIDILNQIVYNYDCKARAKAFYERK